MTTPTDSQILDALMTELDDANLSYPIEWPGIKLTPPATGIWLQCFFQPNSGIDNGLAYTDSEVPRGFLTIMIMTRPGKGIVDLLEAVDDVKAVYPKGLSLVGLVRVIRAPSLLDIDTQDDRIGVGLSIEYSG